VKLIKENASKIREGNVIIIRYSNGKIEEGVVNRIDNMGLKYRRRDSTFGSIGPAFFDGSIEVFIVENSPPVKKHGQNWVYEKFTS